jgi:hypothetical protein
VIIAGLLPITGQASMTGSWGATLVCTNALTAPGSSGKPSATKPQLGLVFKNGLHGESSGLSHGWQPVRAQKGDLRELRTSN